jgi:hypothetical protein
MNLREQIESDLEISLEGDWGLPCELVDPDGNVHNRTVDDRLLVGQILYNTVGMNPENGEQIISNNPILTLRVSSLERIPAQGEKWIVKIPTIPSTTAPLQNFIIDLSKPLEGGASVGFIRLYLKRAVQS